MSRANFLFTSESVSEGHPDKVCDQISDAILDAFITNDVKLGIADESKVNTRLGCETLCTTNKIVIAGEGRGQSPLFHKYGSKAHVNRDMIVQIARDVVKDIGYDQEGFSYHGADVEVLLHGQSPDIAMGVDAKQQGNSEEGRRRRSGYDVRLPPAPRARSMKKNSFQRPRSTAPKFLGAPTSAERQLTNRLRLTPRARPVKCVTQASRRHKVVKCDSDNEAARNGRVTRPRESGDDRRHRQVALPDMDAEGGVKLPGQSDRQFSWLVVPTATAADRSPDYRRGYRRYVRQRRLSGEIH